MINHYIIDFSKSRNVSKFLYIYIFKELYIYNFKRSLNQNKYLKSKEWQNGFLVLVFEPVS